MNHIALYTCLFIYPRLMRTELCNKILSTSMNFLNISKLTHNNHLLTFEEGPKFKRGKMKKIAECRLAILYGDISVLRINYNY